MVYDLNLLNLSSETAWIEIDLQPERYREWTCSLITQNLLRNIGWLFSCNYCINSQTCHLDHASPPWCLSLLATVVGISVWGWGFSGYLLVITMTTTCRNMSSHALMGRPNAILETMVLVFRLVCLGICCTQKAMTFPVWVLFLNLYDDSENRVAQHLTICHQPGHGYHINLISIDCLYYSYRLFDLTRT